MAISYNYTKYANIETLFKEIEDSSIVGILEGISPLDDDGINIWFDDNLSAGDITTLDGIVTAHVYVPVVLPDGYDDEKDVLVRNESGVTITKGTPVYSVGNDPTTGQDLIGIADANDANKVPVIGIMIADVLNNASGAARFVKEIDHLDTSSWNKNDSLYVDVGGGLTTTNPDPATNYTQQLGYVKESGVDEKIFVTISGLHPPTPSGSQIVEDPIVAQSFTTSWNITAAPTQSNGVEIASLIITPEAASSRIRLEAGFSWGIEADAKVSLLSLWRNSTLVGTFGMMGAKKDLYNESYTAILDSPNTTSAVTYSLYGHVDSSTIHIGKNKDGYDAGGTLSVGAALRAIEEKAG